MAEITREGMAEVLDEIAQLLELKGENPFKTRAYRNGAELIRSYSGDIVRMARAGELDQIKGVGEALRDKLQELATSGRLEFYENLRAEFPASLFELFEVQGLGPKKIKLLYDKAGVESVAMLRAKAEAGELESLSGFGKKTVEKILQALDQRERFADRFRLGSVAPLVETILERLRQLDACSQVAIAGSYRRSKETVHDVDFLVASKEPRAVSEFFVKQDEVESVIAQGETKSSVRLANGLQCDLRVVSQAQFPFALQYFTGSKEHNVALRARALQQGLSLNEYGLKPKNEGERSDPSTEIYDEAGIYRELGLDYIEPELRENRGEIEAAEAGELPDLIKLEQLRGTFHNHTTESDGRHSLREMAAAAIDLGLEYLGIADHSKSSFQANGLDEKRLLAQVAEIRRLNQEFVDQGLKFRIFAGSEVDILKDGSLDFSDEVLEQLDYCVASVHQSFQIPEAAMTERLVRAISHPQVTMLGHATGRLLLKREGYAVDLEAVIEAAAEHRKVIELNANPMRLDLDWRWWHAASRRGVLTSINADAHHVDHLQFLSFGVRLARKGWLRKQDVLNTKRVDDVAAWLLNRSPS